ncbi:hypothetical protein OS188_08320 [Xanthomarina sp. F1114]|uniref:hypothetical protein n=1 Tax=Xanthomarina sp. F1114 TaxID=2996019 RepID=UPI00225DD09E|nr:hypothetical protein [Xanthomarina sp. F1114]MCX7547956.1 hypothetical protein [Xanthomarina sp. F1114]
MKPLHYFYSILVLLLIYSCGENQENSELPEYRFQTDNNISNPEPIPIQDKRKKHGLKPYYVMNKQFGMPVGAMPIPGNWEKKEQNSKNIYFADPNGVEVYGEVSNSFFYSNSPERNQYTLQTGSQVKPVKSIQRLIEEELKPLVEAEGYRFKNQFPLPQLAQFDNRFNSYLFKSTPEQRQNDCIVTEWENSEGKSMMVIVRYYIAQYTSIGGLDWGYTLNSLTAPKSEFENAKNAYINSLVNFEINPKWVQAHNQYYAHLAQQNNSRHQQRMANIQAQGEQIRAAGRASSQALDNQYNSWRRRQASSDASHSNYIDGIYERRNMADPSGNTYKIEGYENNVWMNNNNEYIATDNSLYNPNIDNTTNDYNWQQLEESGYDY